jgi:hypothetical protein
MPDFTFLVQASVCGEGVDFIKVQAEVEYIAVKMRRY